MLLGRGERWGNGGVGKRMGEDVPEWRRREGWDGEESTGKGERFILRPVKMLGMIVRWMEGGESREGGVC